MHLKNKLRFTIIVMGALSLTLASRAQEASEKPASELLTRAVREKRAANPTHQSIPPANGARNLPSAQRIITPPKLTTGQPVNYVPRKVSSQEGKRKLRSNSTIQNQKTSSRQKVTRPSVPPAEQPISPEDKQ
jgi:hypothetical protein